MRTMGEHLRADPLMGLGAVGGLILGVWVGLGVFVQALLVVMLVDVVTGLIAAGVQGVISSGASMRGLAKKTTQLILVMLVAWLSTNLGGYLGDGFPGADAVAGAFIVTELISILENAQKVGVSLGPLDRVLAVARQTQTKPKPDPPGPALTGAPHG